MFDRVPLWLCEDITACCYMYCYFRNIKLMCYVFYRFAQGLRLRQLDMMEDNIAKSLLKHHLN